MQHHSVTMRSYQFLLPGINGRGKGRRLNRMRRHLDRKLGVFRKWPFSPNNVASRTTKVPLLWKGSLRPKQGGLSREEPVTTFDANLADDLSRSLSLCRSDKMH
jgi:hypothetical protein